MKKRIFLNGPIHQFDYDTRVRFEVAEAAMRVKFPHAYIFNYYEWKYRKFEEIDNEAKKSPIAEYYVNLEKERQIGRVYDALEDGVFTHMVLMNDWFKSIGCRRAVNKFGIFAELGTDVNGTRINPTLYTLTFEDEMNGREYLIKKELTSKQ